MLTGCVTEWRSDAGAPDRRDRKQGRTRTARLAGAPRSSAAANLAPRADGAHSRSIGASSTPQMMSGKGKRVGASTGLQRQRSRRRGPAQGTVEGLASPSSVRHPYPVFVFIVLHRLSGTSCKFNFGNVTHENFLAILSKIGDAAATPHIGNQNTDDLPGIPKSSSDIAFLPKRGCRKILMNFSDICKKENFDVNARSLMAATRTEEELAR